MQNSNLQFDVIICGAGPAGATCALALGQSGLKVALIEKAVFPRDKICGDAVAAYVPLVLNTIHPKYAEALQKYTSKEMVNSFRIVAPNHKPLDFTFKKHGFISARLQFDNFLFELAAALPNVKIFQDTAVKNVTINEENVLVTAGNDLHLEAKLIIGCDGAHSVVNKQLTGNKVNLKHYAAGVRAYYKNVTGIPAETFELHYLNKILPGYLWIFPLPDNTANVGLGILSKHVADKKLNLRQEMLAIIKDNPYLQERFANAEMIGRIEGFGLPLGSRKVAVSGHRFMLCGDAASLIDPLTGEGIGQAMVSGRYAGWHAIKCFEQNNFSEAFMKGYRKTLYKKLWRTHFKNYIIQKLITNRPWLINASVNLAHMNKFFRNIMQKAFGD